MFQILSFNLFIKQKMTNWTKKSNRKHILLLEQRKKLILNVFAFVLKFFVCAMDSGIYNTDCTLMIACLYLN